MERGEGTPEILHVSAAATAAAGAGFSGIDQTGAPSTILIGIHAGVHCFDSPPEAELHMLGRLRAYPDF